MKVIQCSDCNPPCTFPHKEGWTIPVFCAFWDENNKFKANYKIREITENELWEIFK